MQHFTNASLEQCWQQHWQSGVQEEFFITITDEGLKYGTVILAKRGNDGALMLKGKEQRIRALLAVVYDQAFPDSLLHKIECAEAALNRDGKAMMHMHFALAGFHKLEWMWQMKHLFFANTLLKNGWGIGEMLKCFGISKFNPHHDERGRFTFADNAVAPGYRELDGLTPKTSNEGEFDVAADSGTVSDAKPPSVASNATKGWNNTNTLMDHLKRHAKDFGIKTTEEYVRKASEFWEYAKNNKLPMVEYKKGGNIGVYDPKTNTFGIYTQDGKAKTLYKPARPNYFYNQIKRAETGGGRVINAMSQPRMLEEGGRGGGGAPSSFVEPHSGIPERIKDENN